MTRVLHIVPSFYPAHGYGGPIASLYQLAVAQRAAGHEVRVLTSDADGAGGRISRVQGRWVEDYGVPTWYAPVLRSRGDQGRPRRGKALEDLAPGLLPLLPRWLRWAEVVHVTAVFSPASLAGVLTGVASGRAVVVSPRGSLLPWALAQGRGKKRLLLGALGPALRRVAGWHATSEEEAEALRQTVAGRRARVAVIENGVAVPDARGAGDPEEAELPLQEGDGPVLTMLGRIDAVKGIDLAIAALAVLRRRHPRAVLLLAGPDRDGHAAQLRQQAEALGVGAALRFAGLVVGAHKEALLRRSDQLWLCSRMESFGNVVLEALAAGTPVVAVHTTPWAWLEQQDLGAHCPATGEAIAAAAERWLQRLGAAGQGGEAPAVREERSAFAARSRRAVAQRFAWPAIAGRMDRFYEEVLRGRLPQEAPPT